MVVCCSVPCAYLQVTKFRIDKVITAGKNDLNKHSEEENRFLAACPPTAGFACWVLTHGHNKAKQTLSCVQTCQGSWASGRLRSEGVADGDGISLNSEYCLVARAASQTLNHCWGSPCFCQSADWLPSLTWLLPSSFRKETWGFMKQQTGERGWRLHERRSLGALCLEA